MLCSNKTSKIKKFHVDVHDWPPENMLRSMVSATSNHFDVWESKWSMICVAMRKHVKVQDPWLLPADMCKVASFTVILIAADPQLKLRDNEGFNDILSLPIFFSLKIWIYSLDRKPLERTLKKCDKDAEVWLLTVDGF